MLPACKGIALPSFINFAYDVAGGMTVTGMWSGDSHY